MKAVVLSGRSSRLYYVLTIGLGAALLWLAIRGANWGEMFATFKRAQPSFLVLSFVALSLSYYARGLRWRVLLSHTTPVEPLTVFWATMVGYLGNNFLPARAGELLRTVLIGRSANISKSYVLATAFTERIMDAVALVIVSLGAALLTSNIPQWLLKGTIAIGVVVFAGVIACFVGPQLTSVLIKLLEVFRVPNQFRPRIIELIERFFSGLSALHNWGRAFRFAALTAFVWGTDGFAAILVARSFDLSLYLPVAILLLAALGLSSAIPSTPGSLGVYQFVAVAVMTPFGFSQTDALVYIVAFQAVIYAVVVVWGGAGAWQLSKTVINP